MRLVCRRNRNKKETWKKMAMKLFGQLVKPPLNQRTSLFSSPLHSLLLSMSFTEELYIVYGRRTRLTIRFLVNTSKLPTKRRKQHSLLDPVTALYDVLYFTFVSIFDSKPNSLSLSARGTRVDSDSTMRLHYSSSSSTGLLSAALSLGGIE